jgi:hypothetical protein
MCQNPVIQRMHISRQHASAMPSEPYCFYPMRNVHIPYDRILVFWRLATGISTIYFASKATTVWLTVTFGRLVNCGCLDRARAGEFIMSLWLSISSSVEGGPRSRTHTVYSRCESGRPFGSVPVAVSIKPDIQDQRRVRRRIRLICEQPSRHFGSISDSIRIRSNLFVRWTLRIFVLLISLARLYRRLTVLPKRCLCDVL